MDELQCKYAASNGIVKQHFRYQVTFEKLVCLQISWNTIHTLELK